MYYFYFLGKVVDTTVVAVTDVKNSNAMEKEGFIRILEWLQKEFSIKIDTISTDRHPQIRKLMNVDPRFKQITHEFDPWHVIKGLGKKLRAAGKKR